MIAQKKASPADLEFWKPHSNVDVLIEQLIGHCMTAGFSLAKWNSLIYTFGKCIVGKASSCHTAVSPYDCATIKLGLEWLPQRPQSQSMQLQSPKINRELIAQTFCKTLTNSEILQKLFLQNLSDVNSGELK